MTNKEITKIIYDNTDILALYYGDILVWGKSSGEYGINAFAGKFTDDSTESDWWWKPNKITTSIADKVNPTTKEFNFEHQLDTADHLFSSNNKIEKIYHIPDTSNVTDMKYMFTGCYSLTTLDLSNFNTAACANMSEMFKGCYRLTTLDLSNFNTAACANMSEMFNGCYRLTSLDVGNFNTAACTSMSGMFYSCSGLTSLDLSNFDTSNVMNMENMFSGCNALTSLDVSNFNTAACTSMSGMFDYCNKLTTVNGSFEGTKVNLYIRSCPLTNASAMVFINGLANVTETKTLTLSQTTYDTLSEEQIAVATSKGWTVVSA